MGRLKLIKNGGREQAPYIHKVLMSNRQYAALKMFMQTNDPMQIDEALSVDQRSLGSLFHRGYIKYTGQGFVSTPLGKQAMDIFDTTTVVKDKPGTAFSTYIRTVRALSGYQKRTA